MSRPLKVHYKIGANFHMCGREVVSFSTEDVQLVTCGHCLDELRKEKNRLLQSRTKK